MGILDKLGLGDIKKRNDAMENIGSGGPKVYGLGKVQPSPKEVAVAKAKADAAAAAKAKAAADAKAQADFAAKANAEYEASNRVNPYIAAAKAKEAAKKKMK